MGTKSLKNMYAVQALDIFPGNNHKTVNRRVLVKNYKHPSRTKSGLLLKLDLPVYMQKSFLLSSVHF